MKTVDLLAKLAAQRGLVSDYGIAKFLGVSRSRVSSWRHGVTIGEEMAITIADELALDRGYVLASIAAERTKRTAAKAVWSNVAKKLATAAALGTVLLCGLPAAPEYSLIQTAQAAEPVYTLYAIALAVCLAGALVRKALAPTPGRRP